jgi:hypothetical protein
MCEYHQEQAARLRAILEELIANHEKQAERYRAIGRTSMSTTDKMRENIEKFRTRLEEIRSHWTRSAEAKLQDLQAAYTEARVIHGAFARCLATTGEGGA